MGAIKFIIEGTTYTDAVENDQQLRNTIQRDSKLGGFLETQDAEVTFIGAAHDYLLGVFQDEVNNGFCQLLDCEILEDCEGSDVSLYQGVIKASDIEFNNRLCTAKTKIFDNSFFALIDNNKSLKVELVSTLTKNGEPITGIGLYDLTMFRPSNGNPYGTEAKGYHIKDVLTFVLAWISDNQIGLESNLLDEIGMFLTDGLAIHTLGNDPAGNFGFTAEEILREINKKRKIGFKMTTDTSGNLIMKLEDAEEFFTPESVLNITDAWQVKTKTDKNSLFAAVKVGSKTTDDSPAFSFPENSNLYGFGEEQFTSTGQCNSERVLEQVSDWVYSSNVIEAQLTGSDDYDGNTFVIECENIDTGAKTADAIAHSLPNFSATNRYYNIGFNNLSTLRRLYGFVHNSLISDNETKADRFEARQSTGYRFSNNSAIYNLAKACKLEFFNGTTHPFPTTWCDDPFPWDTETNDPNSNYNPATFEYTVPNAGVYNFTTELQVKRAISLGYWPFCLRVELYVDFVLTDSTGAVTKEIQQQAFVFKSAGTNYRSATANFNCAAGDRVRTRMICIYKVTTVGCLPNNQPTYITVTIGSTNSYFAMTGGYLFNEVNAARVITHETEYPLTPEQYRTLKATPEGFITITSHGEQYEGWIDRAEHRHWTEELKIRIKNRF